MRKITRFFIFAALIFGIIGFNSTGFSGGGEAPVLVLDTPVVDLAKETKVKLKGTGFKPGADLMILFTDQDGVPLDIGWALKPEPKADANGEWAATWNAKRYIEKKMIKSGEYTLSVTDADYNELDSKTIKFVGKFKKKKKKE